MRINPTIQRPLTPEELAARQAFFEQSQREAAMVNEAAMIAQRQIQASQFQDKLVADSGLELFQLNAIKAWLQHNS